ncbi:hypothetical protein MASR2M41_13750 [Flammeovirgaceae bacterium]
MKKLYPILIFLNLILVVGVVVFLWLNNQKVVYVDANKLINGYQRMTDAREEYQAKVNVWKSNIDTLSSELTQRIKEFERDKPRMSSREIAVTQELITTKQNQFREFQQAMNVKAQKEDEEMTKRIVDEINGYLKQYGERHGYAIIFAATNYGNIAYAKEDLDLTEQILKELNDAYVR